MPLSDRNRERQGDGDGCMGCQLVGVRSVTGGREHSHLAVDDAVTGRPSTNIAINTTSNPSWISRSGPQRSSVEG